jgi:hypothetical protein
VAILLTPHLTLPTLSSSCSRARPEGRKRQAYRGGVSLPGAFSLFLSFSFSLSLSLSLCRLPANLQPLCNLLLHLGGGLWSASLPACQPRRRAWGCVRAKASSPKARESGIHRRGIVRAEGAATHRSRPLHPRECRSQRTRKSPSLGKQKSWSELWLRRVGMADSSPQAESRRPGSSKGDMGSPHYTKNGARRSGAVCHQWHTARGAAEKHMPRRPSPRTLGATSIVASKTGRDAGG